MDNIEKTESSSPHKSGTKIKSTSDEPRVVSLPKREASRKRGRPRKGQTVVNQPRRTRPRVTNKPAKICENESDNSVSSEDKGDCGASSPTGKSSEVGKTKVDSNKPQRKRAQIRNKRAFIEESEEEGASSDEKTVKKDFEVGEANDVQMKEIEKYSRTSPVGEEVEAGVGEHAKHESEMSPAETNEIGSGSGSKMPYDDMVDPIQAMLYKMLPSLARGKTVLNPIPGEFTSCGGDSVKEDAPINPIPEEFTSRVGRGGDITRNPLDGDSTRKDIEVNPIPEEYTPRGGDSTQKDVDLTFNPDLQPIKKKKVSYKEMANELLKDW